MLVLNNAEIKELLNMRVCVEVLDDAYREHGMGQAISPPIIQIMSPVSKEHPGTAKPLYHMLRSMPGGVCKLGIASLRIDSDIKQWRTIGGFLRMSKVPAARGGRWVGLILLFDVNTCEPLALFPDGYIQGMRVGATNGLGIRYLARSKAAVLGILGSGWQARTHVQAACVVRPIATIKVYSPNAEHRRRFAEEVSREVGVPIEPVGRAEDLVRAADIVIAATDALQSVIEGAWLQEGTHLGTVRDLEIDDAAYRRCDVIVASRRGSLWHDYTYSGHEDIIPEFHGVGRNAIERWGDKSLGIDWEALPTLGEVMIGKAAGRTRDTQITYLLNKGDGHQFAAVGAKVYSLAQERGLGREIPTDWLLQEIRG